MAVEAIKETVTAASLVLPEVTSPSGRRTGSRAPEVLP